MKIIRCAMSNVRGHDYPLIQSDAPENSPAHQFLYFDGREYVPSMVEPFVATPNGDLVTPEGIRHRVDAHYKLQAATALIDRMEGLLKDRDEHAAQIVEYALDEIKTWRNQS